MKPIKFRLWTGELMTYPFTLEDLHDSPYPVPQGSPDKKEIINYPLGENIVMQFTGLRDGAGQEIYDQDIVTYGPDECVVEWGDVGWIVRYLRFNYKKPLYSGIANVCEIIGNSFETKVEDDQAT